MRIATYNINGINARLPVLLRWLDAYKPDVACLQELKATDDKFPRAELEKAGYGAIWHGQKSWNGVAILTRDGQPHETRRGLPGDTEDSQSRYLEAAVDGVLIGCLYLPNGNPIPGPKFDYKLEWFKRFQTHALELIGMNIPVVLAGDYNVIPTDFDAFNPKSWKNDALFQSESQAAYRDLLAQGWTDSVRALHPDEQIFTYWDYFRNRWERNSGLRIDHLLVSPALSPRLEAAGVDREVRGWEKTSDHAPTWLRLTDA
jgi:exodeoxyribonuclease-3